MGDLLLNIILLPGARVHEKRPPSISPLIKGESSAVPPFFITLSPLTETKREALLQSFRLPVPKLPSATPSLSRLPADGPLSLIKGGHVLFFVITFRYINRYIQYYRGKTDLSICNVSKSIPLKWSILYTYMAKSLIHRLTAPPAATAPLPAATEGESFCCMQSPT